jgi:hypothetical protein
MKKARTTLVRLDQAADTSADVDSSEEVPADLIDKAELQEEGILRHSVPKRKRYKFTVSLIQTLKNEFGFLEPTALNVKTIRSAAGRIMKQHGVRESHQFDIMQQLLPAVFTLTDAELEAKRKLTQLINPPWFILFMRWTFGTHRFVDRCHRGDLN